MVYVPGSLDNTTSHVQVTVLFVNLASHWRWSRAVQARPGSNLSSATATLHNPAVCAYAVRLGHIWVSSHSHLPCRACHAIFSWGTTAAAP